MSAPEPILGYPNETSSVMARRVQNLQTEEIAKLRSDGGILSKRTWATQSGLNYDDEQENKRLEPKEVAPGPLIPGVQQPPSGFSKPLSESIEGASKDHWKAYP